MSRAFHPVKTKFGHGRTGAAPHFCPSLQELALSSSAHPQKLIAHPVARLQGRARAPGDKSVSHRALMFGAMALGETAITGLLTGEDVLCTAAALRAMGAQISHENTNQDGGVWRVRGFGVGGGQEPGEVLDLGNSGTAARLLTGILASHPFTSFMTGDASLRSRPMKRVMDPLGRMGARFEAREGGRMPLCIVGTDEMVPIEYRLPMASAQVKSCVLLAGLNTAGETTVIEPEATRDHTERMLRHFGAEVRVEPAALKDVRGGGKRITVVGWPELKARDIDVPGDPSSAAFAVVAAAIRPGSDVVVENVGINPLRAGLYTTLKEMGADLAYRNQREVGGEPVADLHVKGGGLKGVEVPPERAPTMIDEYPILAVAAACARGTTRMLGLAELRAKESDRLSSVAAGLAANGVKHEMGADSLTVHGDGKVPGGGGLVKTHLDHRIAMAFLVLGLGAREAVAIDDGSAIDTSFPGFAPLMNGLGAKIETAK
jgi:3-phosphoshikimate 1-carboxyvinyltransferase